GIDKRLADRLFVRKGRNRRGLRQKAQNGELLVILVLVEGGKRVHRRRQRRHRVRVPGKSVVKPLHVLVKHGVPRESEPKLLELLLVWQTTVNQQVTRLHERGFFRKLLDGIAPVAQNAAFSIQKR